MKKVLWFSRHELTEAQLAGLKKIASDSDLTVKTVNKTVSSAEEIVSEADQDTAIFAIVAPVQILSDLKKLTGATIAVPRSKRIKKENMEFEFVHDFWEVVDKCEYEFHVVR